MRIGIPKEIKNNEFRIGMTPTGVRELCRHGHHVSVQASGGEAIGYSDEDYKKAGAVLVNDASDLFEQAELIIKVKEPQPNECQMLRPGQILFTYLHLAPDPVQTKLLMESGATCIAYETVTDENGGLPLLAPMSEVAGRMAAQEAAVCLEKENGGRGVLMGGVPGVEPANILVIGGGVVGLNAARAAEGMGADVTIADRSLTRLRHIEEIYGSRIRTLYSTHAAIERALPTVDAVIGAVLVPGAAAPKLVTREMLELMRPGSVLVDVAIDQGGCFETSRPTTHADPIYTVNGIVHYCVANMPGAVARTSTQALTNATLPYILKLADSGAEIALNEDRSLLDGLNVYKGMITQEAVADAQELSFTPPAEALGL